LPQGVAAKIETAAGGKLMTRRRRGYISVEVDLNEALEEIDDAMLLQEIKDRKLGLGLDCDDPQEDLRDARLALLRGHPAEALAIFDRLINPKWDSVSSANTAYQMTLKDAK
jgi:hypothetical protein